MAAIKASLCGVFLGLLVLHLTNATLLDCSRFDAAQCKIAFSDLFDQDISALHRTFSIKVLTGKVDVLRSILNDLPQKDPHREAINRKISELTNLIESYRRGNENIKQTVDLLGQRKVFEPEFGDTEFDAASKKIYDKLREKHSQETDKIEMEAFEELYAGVTKSWSEIYEGLRESDLSAYPEYSGLNNSHKFLVISGDYKSMLYYSLVETSTKFLNLRYYRKLLQEIQNLKSAR